MLILCGESNTGEGKGSRDGSSCADWSSGSGLSVTWLVQTSGPCCSPSLLSPQFLLSHYLALAPFSSALPIYCTLLFSYSREKGFKLHIQKNMEKHLVHK